jgi:hypothetical protein
VTAISARVLPGVERPVLLATPPLLTGLAAAVLAAGGHGWAAAGVAMVVAVACGVALHVDLPWGGRLTLGHAVIIAIVARVEPRWALLIALAGVVVALPSWLDHAEEGPLRTRLGGAAAVGIASVAAVVVRFGIDAALPVSSVSSDDDQRAMLVAVLVGLAFLAVDHALRGVVARTIGERSDLRQAWPLYVTLLCVATLIDLAAPSVPLAFVATVPLLVTRFAFPSYTSARVTYEQTTKALSLLPEVAGLTPLGHSERTAAYVEAVADAMGYEPLKVEHLANAARLHHIGDISLHEETERDGPPDPSDLATVSVEILQQTGFLANLVDLVEDCQPGGPPASTQEAAVIRVCSMLDELVETSDAFDPFATLVAMHPVGHERAVAIALLSLSHRRPSLVADARASVELMHQVAVKAAAGHDHHH